MVTSEATYAPTSSASATSSPREWSPRRVHPCRSLRASPSTTYLRCPVNRTTALDDGLAPASQEGRGRPVAHGALREDAPQVRVVEVGVLLGRQLAPGRVVVRERGRQLRGVGAAPAAAGRDEGRLLARLVHQRVDVLQLRRRSPPVIASAPLVRRRGEPDGEGLGEVLVGVRLRVPVRQVAHEAPAIRPGAVPLGLVLDVRAPEDRAPAPSRGEPIRVVHGVSALVTQELRARFRRPALDVHHLPQLELLEPRVRKVKGDRDGRFAFRAEPFVAEIAGRADRQAASAELFVELRDARFERAPLDLDPQVADPEGEKLLVSEGGPGRIHPPKTSPCESALSLRSSVRAQAPRFRGAGAVKGPAMRTSAPLLVLCLGAVWSLTGCNQDGSSSNPQDRETHMGDIHAVAPPPPASAAAAPPAAPAPAPAPAPSGS